MNLGLRISNGLLIIVLIAAVISIARELNGYAEFVGASAWLLAPITAIPALGRKSSRAMRGIAFWVNVLAFIGLAAVAVFTNDAQARIGLAVIGIPVALNAWSIRALLKGSGAGEPSTHDASPEGSPDSLAPPAEGSLSLPDSAAVDGFAQPSPSRSLASPEPSANYLVRHWRGELSLPVSYWVNGSLVGFALLALASAGALLLTGATVRTGATVGSLLLIMTVVTTVWSSVGILRSARHHKSRGGSAGWAATAQIVTWLGLLIFGVTLFNNILPQLKESMLIAAGLDPMGRIKANVTTHGTALVLRGLLGAGSAEDVSRLLASAPAVRTMVLDSSGGRLGEAKRIADLVRERKLNTYVETHCESACTYIFLAGIDRAATPNARLGFHRPTFPGINKAAEAEMTDEMLSVYRRSGINQRFLERVARTNTASMWYPTRAELLENGVINRVSLGGETDAMSSDAYRSKDELTLVLRRDPVMAALDGRFPGTITQAVEASWKSYRDGLSDAEIQGATRATMASYYPRLLAMADDEHLDSYVQLLVDQITAAQAISDKACGLLVQAKLDITKALPPELAEREQQWILSVLGTSSISPDMPVDAAGYETAMTRVTGNMPKDMLEVISRFDAYSAQPELQCQATFEFYSRVAKLPKDARYLLLEGLFHTDKASNHADPT